MRRSLSRAEAEENAGDRGDASVNGQTGLLRSIGSRSRSNTRTRLRKLIASSRWNFILIAIKVTLAAEEKFKEVGEAYAVFSDQNKRAQYDRFGHVQGGGAASASGAGRKF
jgi:hypothetical protein